MPIKVSKMSFLGEQGSLLKTWVQQKIQEGIPEEFLPKVTVVARASQPNRKRKRTEKEMEILKKVRIQNENFVLNISEEISDNRNWWEFEFDVANEWRYFLIDGRYRIKNYPEDWSEYDWYTLWNHSTSEDANLPF